MKHRIGLFALSWAIAALLSACNTAPPAPPSCDGRVKIPINGRAVSGGPVAMVNKEESDGGSCGHS